MKPSFKAIGQDIKAALIICLIIANYSVCISTSLERSKTKNPFQGKKLTKENLQFGYNFVEDSFGRAAKYISKHKIPKEKQPAVIAVLMFIDGKHEDESQKAIEDFLNLHGTKLSKQMSSHFEKRQKFFNEKELDSKLAQAIEEEQQQMYDEFLKNFMESDNKFDLDEKNAFRFVEAKSTTRKKWTTFFAVTAILGLAVGFGGNVYANISQAHSTTESAAQQFISNTNIAIIASVAGGIGFCSAIGALICWFTDKPDSRSYIFENLKYALANFVQDHGNKHLDIQRTLLQDLYKKIFDLDMSDVGQEGENTKINALRSIRTFADDQNITLHNIVIYPTVRFSERVRAARAFVKSKNKGVSILTDDQIEKINKIIPNITYNKKLLFNQQGVDIKSQYYIYQITRS